MYCGQKDEILERIKGNIGWQWADGKSHFEEIPVLRTVSKLCGWSIWSIYWYIIIFLFIVQVHEDLREDFFLKLRALLFFPPLL